MLMILIISLQSAFLKATNSGWYTEFLKSTVEIVTTNPASNRILDIGTGPGTLPEMLIAKDSSLHITGIDIDTAMINIARKRFSHRNVSFQYEKINAHLEFDDNQFDVVTFCSILFLVDDNVKTNLVNDALRVLKPGGKLFVLNPSGKKSILSAPLEVWKYPFDFDNWTFIVWKLTTTGGARKWQKQKWLELYAKNKNLKYEHSLTFNNNASIETITKSIDN
jgi:ubiquinone/menaquinone biosynthesis C-methylase UbiE